MLPTQSKARAFLLIAALLAWGCDSGSKARSDQPLVILEYEVAPEGQNDAIQAMRKRIDDHAVTNPVVVPRGASGIHVELSGDPDVLAQTIEMLERSAALGVHAIVEDDPNMDMIYSAARDDQPVGISVDREEWQGADGRTHALRYLWAADRGVLDAWLATRQLVDGRRIVLEREETPSRWRTHAIDLAAIVTGRDIATASITYDQVTVRPEVQLELTKASAMRFGDATAALVGHKLAIVLDGRVVSAPVVTAPIRGGRIAITMGGDDPRKQEAEARALVDVLKAGSMPPVRRIAERHVGPAR